MQRVKQVPLIRRASRPKVARPAPVATGKRRGRPRGAKKQGSESQWTWGLK
jgi:hypothetical protein